MKRWMWTSFKVNSAIELELAHPPREPLTGAAGLLEMRLHPIRIRLSLGGIVDGVLGIVDDAFESKGGVAVATDPTVQEVPARLGFLAVRGAEFPVGDLTGKAVRVALGIVVVLVVRRARHGDIPGTVVLGRLGMRQRAQQRREGEQEKKSIHLRMCGVSPEMSTCRRRRSAAPAPTPGSCLLYTSDAA